MAEPLEQIIQKCDKQLEGLFMYLGSVVCDRAARGEIRIQFDPQAKEFRDELAALFRRIRDLEHRDLGHRDPGHQPAAASVSHLANRRGTLSPYVDLNIKLHEIKKRFSLMREDVDSCLEIASLHLKEENRGKAGHFSDRLDNAEHAINLLFEKISGSVREAMDLKKEAMDEAGADKRPISKDEKNFFKEAEAQIEAMTHGVGTFFGEAITFFEGLKSFYEQDAGKDGIPEFEEFSGDRTRERADEDPGRDVADGGIVFQEKVAPEEKDFGEEDIKELEAEEEAREEELYDESLMRAVERKLLAKDDEGNDRLHTLTTLFQTVEAEAVANFLIGFFERAPLIEKIEVLGIVTKVVHPGLEKVYEQFLKHPEPLLRLKGLVGYGKFHPEAMSSLMMNAATDADSTVRRLAANCIRPEGTNLEFAMIMKMINDADDQVARVAIKKLVSFRSNYVISRLVPKLLHANPKIRDEVFGILKSMTGKTFGYRADAPERERDKAVKAWADFLKDSPSQVWIPAGKESTEMLPKAAEQSAAVKRPGMPLKASAQSAATAEKDDGWVQSPVDARKERHRISIEKILQGSIDSMGDKLSDRIMGMLKELKTMGGPMREAKMTELWNAAQDEKVDLASLFLRDKVESNLETAGFKIDEKKSEGIGSILAKLKNIKGGGDAG